MNYSLVLESCHVKESRIKDINRHDKRADCIITSADPRKYFWFLDLGFYAKARIAGIAYEDVLKTSIFL